MKLLIITLLLLSSSAFAKHFYKQKFIFELTHNTPYKSVKIAHQKATARYSDDGSYCELEIKNTKINCIGNGNTFWIRDYRTLLSQIGIDDATINEMEPQLKKYIFHLEYGIYQIHTNDPAESYHLKIQPRAEKRVD